VNRARIVAACGLLAGLAAPAAAQDGRPSEDDLFGGPAAPVSTAPESAAPVAPAPESARTVASGDDRGDALLGGAARPAERSATLDAETLAVGGRLLLRAQAQLYASTDAADQPLSSPNLLDVYLDARPSERVRAFAEVRAQYNPTLEGGRAALPDYCPETPPPDDPGNAACQAGRDALRRALAPSPSSYALNQLWLKFDLAQRVYVTVGKQPVQWGAGHIWNPTDFVNRTKRDPLTTVDLRSGVTLVKLHAPFEATTSNLYALAILDEANTLGDVGGALRGELALSRAEVTLSVAGRKGRPLLVGGDASLGLGPLDVFAEAAVAHGHHTPLAGQRDRDNDWIPQVSAGVSAQVDYGDDDALTVGLEYFHNDDGVRSRAQYGPALAAGRGFFDLPRNAVGLFLLALAPGRLDDSSIFATAIAQLDDGSATARLQWSERALTWLTVMPYVGGYFGGRGDLLRPSGLDPETAQPTAALLTAEAGVWLSMSL